MFFFLQDGGGKYPAEYSYDSFDSNKTGLDFNHSHFILVDNGTSGQYGTEIELRSQLEGAIAKYLKTSSNAATGLKHNSVYFFFISQKFCVFFKEVNFNIYFYFINELPKFQNIAFKIVYKK